MHSTTSSPATSRAHRLLRGAGASTAACVLLAGCSGGSGGSSAGSTQDSAGGITIGLITKTNTNPYFVAMKEAAQEQAKKRGVTLKTYAGKVDGDNQGQVEAVENLIASGAKGILITPNDSKAIVPTLDKARQAGLFVISLDATTQPADAVDATFATDNFHAGQLIGQWAKSRFEAEGKDPKIAMLDLNQNQISVDVDRDQGFLDGFGIDVKDKTKIGDESDPRIVGHALTKGASDGGRTAMENLLQKDDSINLVYTINEPAAAGAYEAIKAAGKEKDITLVSIDGACDAMPNVKSGAISATSMQFPKLMASKGVDAVIDYVKTGKKPAKTGSLEFTDTGVQLVSDSPASGVESQESAWGTQNCWG